MKFNLRVSMNDPLALKKVFFLCVFLGALSITASHAGINNYQNSFEPGGSFNQPTLFENNSTSSHSNSSGLFIEQPLSFDSNNFTPFSSKQNSPNPSNQTYGWGFGDDDDFGDEEIGIIPVGDAVWLLLLLSLGYVYITLRRHKQSTLSY